MRRIGLMAVAALAVSSAGAGRLAAQDVGIDLGTVPEAVQLEDLDGKAIDLAQYVGKKPVLIEFWATWCPPCMEELPNVRDNYDRYHDKGFDVVGISLDRTKQDLEEFLTKEKLPWVTLYEEGGRHPAVEFYAIESIPTVILVDKEGKVVSLNARGDELGELLAKLLGPAEKAAKKTAK